jgi:predicted HTH domain antitoxin
MADIPDKPTSKKLRREAEKLRETAIDLMEHAALVIAQSVELEKRILEQDNVKAHNT